MVNNWKPTHLSPVQETLEEVKKTLRAHFEIVDWQGVEILLAIACAHYISGEMLWVRFLGPSRSGKTELLRAICMSPDCAELEVFTPASIRGGYKKGPKVLELIKGKLVITKDAAALLTSRSEVKSEIFGLLRNVKDGKLTADFGSDEGHLVQDVNFDWILAATSAAIEQQRTMEGLLGQRFIDLRWIPGNREDMAYRAALNNEYLNIIRATLARDVLSLMYRAKEEAESEDYKLTDDDMHRIARVADVTAMLRTPIQEDRHGHLLGTPELEVGTDLSQGFSRVAKGLHCIGFTDCHAHIKRLAWDCIPPMRVSLLSHLGQNPSTVEELTKLTNIPKRTVYYHLEQCKLLKAIKDVGGIKTIMMELP